MTGGGPFAHSLSTIRPWRGQERGFAPPGSPELKSEARQKPQAPQSAVFTRFKLGDIGALWLEPNPDGAAPTAIADLMPPNTVSHVSCLYTKPRSDGTAPSNQLVPSVLPACIAGSRISPAMAATSRRMPRGGRCRSSVRTRTFRAAPSMTCVTEVNPASAA